MIKLTKEEFIEELTAELYGYEEISENQVKEFIDFINNYFEKKQNKKNRISYNPNSIIIKFEDETEIFRIADSFFSAIVNDELKEFYKYFQL